jgi:alanine-glyoxylate transaminase/serine-glyoxylate transaminase/serine-pyruvate transaminase
MSVPGQLSPSPRVLLGPGPSDVHPRVLTAMATPLVGHLDPYFLAIMNETQEMLRQAFRTSNRLTFPISATGMAGMECCIVNLIEPGDKMVVCAAGFFGGRMIEVAGRTGAQLTVLERPWGEVFDLKQLREVLQKVRPKVLSIVQAETSTGAWQPIEELGKLCHEFDTLLLVDAVTALGCVPLLVDAWGIDAIYSCSQKGLSCPPGLSPVSFSARAVDTINRRKTKVQSWYLDMTIIQKYWGQERAYHHTAPITMIYALREGLRLLHEEGLEQRWERHLQNHRALKAGLTAMGLTYTAAEGHQLPQLNAVRIPAGVDDALARKQLLEEFGIEIGSGLGEFKGKAWRIGLMGHNSRPANVLLVLSALEKCLMAQGAKVTPGAGVGAAAAAYDAMKRVPEEPIP